MQALLTSLENTSMHLLKPLVTLGATVTLLGSPSLVWAGENTNLAGGSAWAHELLKLFTLAAFALLAASCLLYALLPIYRRVPLAAARRAKADHLQGGLTVVMFTLCAIVGSGIGLRGDAQSGAYGVILCVGSLCFFGLAGLRIASGSNKHTKQGARDAVPKALILGTAFGVLAILFTLITNV